MRLRPITFEIPKPLVTINKKPLLNYQVELLVNNKINEIGIIAEKTHKKEFEIWSKTWHFSPARIKIFFQKSSIGTFGALTHVRSWLNKSSFVVTNSDELKRFSLKSLIDFHAKHAYDGTLALVKVKNPQDYSVPLVKANKIMELREKPKNPHSPYIYSGLCILSPDIFKYLNPGKEQSLHLDLFPILARAKKLAGVKIPKSRWQDCGTLALWENAIHAWRK